MKANTDLNICHLSEDQVGKIHEISDSRTYPIKTELYYEGHVPVVGYLVIDGNVEIVKNKKVRATASRGDIIGVKELMNHCPATHSAQITPNTRVCFLDRSTILELIKKSESDRLSVLFKGIISA